MPLAQSSHIRDAECSERIVIAHLSSLAARSIPRRMPCSSVGYPCRTTGSRLLPRV